MILLPNLLKFYHQNKEEYDIKNYTFEEYLENKQKRMLPLAEEGLPAEEILPGDAVSFSDIAEEFPKEVSEMPKESEEEQVSAAELEAEARERAELVAQEIREKAEAEAAELLEEAKRQAEVLRQQAQDEGFKEGYEEGYAKSMTDVKEVAEVQSRQYLEEIRDIVERTAEEKEEVLQKYKKDLRSIAIAVAEKVIHVSLKSSGDVIERMILSATEKLKTREWAKIYISKSDADIMLRGDRDLVQALARLSDHVKVVVMENEKPGTCIIELPDEIIDASASTQMENIKEILNSTGI